MSNAGFTRKAAAMTTVTFDAPGLGDRSYLISDGEVGVVVDPQRDPFPYLQEAEKLGVSITAVLETHVHNDYVSGGLALSRATGATYAIPAGEPVSFSDEFRALDDGDTLAVGRLEVTAIATAGHTAHHLAYLVKLADGADDEEGARACRVHRWLPAGQRDRPNRPPRPRASPRRSPIRNGVRSDGS